MAPARWLLAAASTAVLMSAGCAARLERPRVIALDQVRASAEPRAEFIDDYESALVSIAAIAERDLGLPTPSAVVHLMPDRDALYDVLRASGADDGTAQSAAATMLAVGGHRAVYVNLAAFARLNWNARIAVLSHELTHVAQYELSDGRRGASDQWLREGFADWVQAHVLDRLGVLTRDGIRARNARFVTRPGARTRLPSLAQLVDFPAWVEATTGPDGQLVYPYAYLAADFLIARHGLPAALDYFRLSAQSGSATAFTQAFGESRETFARALDAHLAQMRVPD